VASFERLQLLVQDGSPLGVPKPRACFTGEGHAKEPLVVPGQGAKSLYGKLIEHGARLVLPA
jgi:hypothetical protein